MSAKSYKNEPVIFFADHASLHVLNWNFFWINIVNQTYIIVRFLLQHLRKIFDPFTFCLSNEFEMHNPNFSWPVEKN